MNNKILVTNLYKAFGTKKILNGTSIAVEKGKSLVIIGGSGTGKSVLLKSIIGLLDADSGSIQIDGTEMIGANSAIKQKEMEKIGFLFQGGALFDSLAIWENIAFKPLMQRKVSRIDGYALAIEKLAMVGMVSDIADLRPSELSGGMQKRVSLARAIASNPEIIFFDEPTTGLDPIMADVINNLIVKCSEELGATTISITHDMKSAMTIADNVAMIYQGKIIWHGDADDMEHSGNPFVDQFVFGKSEGPIDINVKS